MSILVRLFSDKKICLDYSFWSWSNNR